jgi:hypothetical protein
MEDTTIHSLGVVFSILGWCPLPCRIAFVRPEFVAEGMPFKDVRPLPELILRAL